MNNQKNRFWTFCFSLVPGAGEMYFGLYRQGISLKRNKRPKEE